MDNFLDEYHIPKLNIEAINNLNSPITSKERKTIIKITPPQKPRARWFQGKFLPDFQRGSNTYTPQIVPREIEGILPNSFYESTITLTLKPKKDVTKKRITDQSPSRTLMQKYSTK